jgi:hypothetical protein
MKVRHWQSILLFCRAAVLFIDLCPVVSVVVRYTQYLLDLCDSFKVGWLRKVLEFETRIEMKKKSNS